MNKSVKEIIPLILIFILVLTVIFFTACKGGGNGEESKLSSDKEINYFCFPAAINHALSTDVMGIIIGTDIILGVPMETDVTGLVATFVATGVGVMVGGTVQTSGITANNFTVPVVYSVTAEDGGSQDYIVTLDRENIVDTVTKVIPGGSITLSGTTLNDGIDIKNSKQILFGFNRTMDSDDTLLDIRTPHEIEDINYIIKDGCICAADGGTTCTGSVIAIIGHPDPTILIRDANEDPGTSLFITKIEAVDYLSIKECNWEIKDDEQNADIQFVRAMPEISITYTDEVFSGECIRLSAIATPVFKPSTHTPVPTFSYTWTQTVGMVVFFGSLNTSTLILNAPFVYEDTELTFQLTVTDDLGLTTKQTVTVKLLAL